MFSPNWCNSDQKDQNQLVWDTLISEAHKHVNKIKMETHYITIQIYIKIYRLTVKSHALMEEVYL